MAAANELNKLIQKYEKPWNIKEIFLRIANTLTQIQAIIDNPQWSMHEELEEKLNDISHFFITEKFSTTVLSVLELLAMRDANSWSLARLWASNTPLTPASFENMRKSCRAWEAPWWESPEWVRDREIALLWVYGITMDTLGETFRILSKSRNTL